MSERTLLAQADAAGDAEVDMDMWTELMGRLGYLDDASRARALQMHHSVISRLRAGKAKPGPRFISRTVALGIPYFAVFRNGGQS